MNVLYIAFNYPPETGAGAVRTSYNVEALRAAGHRVLVLAPLPNYPEGQVFKEWRGRLRAYDEREDVLRTWIKPSQARRPLLRSAPYASFNLSGFSSGLQKQIGGGHFDVIVATAPPLPAVAFAAPLSTLLRKPLVLDVRDIWPDVGLYLGLLKKGAIESRLTRACEQLLLRQSTACVVTATGDRENLIDKGVEPDRVTVIPNGANTELFRPDRALAVDERIARYGGRPGFSAVYCGSFNFGMNDMEVLARVAQDVARTRPGYTMYYVGAGEALKDIKAATRNGPASPAIRFIPPMQQEELAPLVASCDAGFIPRKGVRDTGGSLPVKMFEFWSAGLPVALGANEGSHALSVFSRIRAGVPFRAGDVEGAIHALDALERMGHTRRAAMGKDGRSLVEREFSRKDLAEQFRDLVESAASEGKQGSPSRHRGPATRHASLVAAGPPRLKVAILTQYFPPEIGAQPARLSELATCFRQRGHDVTVLTAMPNYPVGKVFPGYGGLVQREDRDGLKIRRTFIYPTQKADFIRRPANYLSFVLSSGTLGARLVGPIDYIFVQSPPLFLGVSGIWLSNLKRARMIFNVSDLWPQTGVSLGAIRPGGLTHRLSSALERICYQKAWLVTGQSEGILESITSRYPNTHAYLLSNGVDTARFRPQDDLGSTRRSLAEPSEFLVLYAGLHGVAQGLQQVLDAAEAIGQSSTVRFTLVGDGPEKSTLQSQARERGLDQVRFNDICPPGDIPKLLAASDAILVPLRANIPGAVPSKLYEAMASGKPIILVAQGEPARIVREHDAGVVVPPGDVGALVEAIQRLAGDRAECERLGGRGRLAARRHFDRTAINTRFIEYLEARHAGGPQEDYRARSCTN